VRDSTDVLDAIVVGLLVLIGIGWIIAGLVMTLGGFLLFSVPGFLVGIIVLCVAIGLFHRKPEAWGISVAATAFILAWSTVAIAISRRLPGAEDLLALLTEAGFLAYLLLRRERFGAGRKAGLTAPSG
jgi:hypothetical protein